MPRRWVFRAILLSGLVLLATVPTVTAQVSVADEVVFRDPATGKIETVKAVLKESPAGISYTDGKNQKTISPSDIIRVDYSSLVGVSEPDRLLTRGREVDPASPPAQVQKQYSDLQKKAGAAAPEKTRRALAFRETYWATKVIDAKATDDFAKEAPAVIAKLQELMTVSKKSWECWPATRTLARIYTELGQHGEAAKAWGSLASVPDLPPQLKIEAQLAEAAANIRAGGGLAAEGAVEAIAKSKDVPATGPIPDRIAVLRVAAKVPFPKTPGEAAKPPADAVAKLEAAIAQVKDPSAKAVGYNFLGDTHNLNGAKRDALWAYLWVDVVYGGDPVEQVYAVRHLIEAFEAGNDQERADQFREKLTRVR